MRFILLSLFFLLSNMIPFTEQCQTLPFIVAFIIIGCLCLILLAYIVYKRYFKCYTWFQLYTILFTNQAVFNCSPSSTSWFSDYSWFWAIPDFFLNFMWKLLIFNFLPLSKSKLCRVKFKLLFNSILLMHKVAVTTFKWWLYKCHLM